MNRLDRRMFLRLAAFSPALARAAAEEKLPPVRAITQGPKIHWFGYYDKLEFDPTNRYVLGMESDFENRSPVPGDKIRVGMVDLQDHDRWIELGESRAWNWQQGCMLQWLPGSQTEVIWNDLDGDRYVCRIFNTKTSRSRTVPAPIYAIDPTGRWTVAPDFRRLHDWRPGYGYAGLPDPNASIQVPRNAGVWRTDLRTGQTKLIVPFAEAARIPYANGKWDGATHWFNHLLVAPDGKRFSFLHRWGVRKPDGKIPFTTRMFTARPDGTGMYCLDPNGGTSHYIWRDPKHILAWATHPSQKNKFYLFEDKTDRVEAVAPDVMTVNGHCTYLPGNKWILNDTYPDRERLQHPYLYNVASGRRVPLGHFPLPKQYTGEWRCDLHPRCSRDGKMVAIDSPHGGNGRQMYLIDISGIA